MNLLANEKALKRAASSAYGHHDMTGLSPPKYGSGSLDSPRNDHEGRNPFDGSADDLNTISGESVIADWGSEDSLDSYREKSFASSWASDVENEILSPKATAMSLRQTMYTLSDDHVNKSSFLKAIPPPLFTEFEMENDFADEESKLPGMDIKRENS